MTNPFYQTCPQGSLQLSAGELELPQVVTRCLSWSMQESPLTVQNTLNTARASDPVRGDCERSVPSRCSRSGTTGIGWPTVSTEDAPSGFSSPVLSKGGDWVPEIVEELVAGTDMAFAISRGRA